METRRNFIQKLLLLCGTIILRGNSDSSISEKRKKQMNTHTTVYRSINGSSSENMEKVLELIDGIETIVGYDDIVIIKPNVQWWNQGVPNISAVETLISLIINRSGGFAGEVILAENNHCGSEPWKKVGWNRTFERNSDISGINNYNELSNHCKNKFGDQFSACHWIDIAAGGKRVYSPKDGTGYVLCDGTGGVPLLCMDNGASGNSRREVIISYPIFQTDKGTIIDFKNGFWENGAYTKQPLKFINIAALNHHSTYCGITSSVKNHLGVTDLSGGSDPENDGKLTEKYYNFHSFPFNKWAPGPASGMLGAEIGMFFNEIRKPDLNITTAEWVGLASRTEQPVARTRAVLASRDPVALDFHAAKYLVYPNSRIPIHNPDNEKGPLYIDLQKCAQKSNLVLDENYVDIVSYDFHTKKLQDDNELVIKGDIHWGHDIKSLLKYFLLRFGIV